MLCLLLIAVYVWSTTDHWLYLQLKSNFGRRFFKSQSRNEWNIRQSEIQAEMQFVWEAYETHAMGADEIGPLDGKPKNDIFGGVALTLIDGLDTLLVMDMKAEFQRATKYIRRHVKFTNMKGQISVFEANIRLLGGLLSAYEMTGDVLFRERAQQLADILCTAFDPKDKIFDTLYFPESKASSHSSSHLFR